MNWIKEIENELEILAGLFGDQVRFVSDNLRDTFGWYGGMIDKGGDAWLLYIEYDGTLGSHCTGDKDIVRKIAEIIKQKGKREKE